MRRAILQHNNRCCRWRPHSNNNNSNSSSNYTLFLVCLTSLALVFLASPQLVSPVRSELSIQLKLLSSTQRSLTACRQPTWAPLQDSHQVSPFKQVRLQVFHLARTRTLLREVDSQFSCLV